MRRANYLENHTAYKYSVKRRQRRMFQLAVQDSMPRIRFISSSSRSRALILCSWILSIPLRMLRICTSIVIRSPVRSGAATRSLSSSISSPIACTVCAGHTRSGAQEGARRTYQEACGREENDDCQQARGREEGLSRLHFHMSRK